MMPLQIQTSRMLSVVMTMTMVATLTTATAATTSKEEGNLRRSLQPFDRDPSTISFKDQVKQVTHMDEGESTLLPLQTNPQYWLKNFDELLERIDEHVVKQEQQEGGIENDKDSVIHPLILNIGQGTTGTHSYHEATCEYLGLKTIHWGAYCFPSIVENAEDLSLPEIIALSSHIRMKTIHDIWTFDCLPGFEGERRQANPESDECTYESLQAYMNEMTFHMKLFLEMSTRYGGIESVHETPYAVMVPFILEEMKHMGSAKTKGIQLIMSQRDPLQWTESRLKGHARTSIWCRDMWYTAEGNFIYNHEVALKRYDVTGELSSKRQVPPPDMFDLVGCLERAMSREDKSYNKVTDVFVNVPLLMKESSEELNGDLIKLEQRERIISERVMIAFNEFQTMYLEDLVWTNNVFLSDHKVSAEELALEMKPHLQFLPETPSETTTSFYDAKKRLEQWQFARDVEHLFDEFLLQ